MWLTPHCLAEGGWKNPLILLLKCKGFFQSASFSQRATYFKIPFIWDITKRQIQRDRRWVRGCEGMGKGFKERWLSGWRICLQCRRHRRCEFNPWVGKIPWRRKWQPSPVFLLGKCYGQRSLAGYSPWGRTKSRTQLRRLNTRSPWEGFLSGLIRNIPDRVAVMTSQHGKYTTDSDCLP